MQLEEHKSSKMMLLSVVSILITTATSQYQNAPPQIQPPPHPKYLGTGAIYQAAPLHYVNIGAQLAGDYSFGYDTGKGPSGQSFREEIRLADGSVKGSYGVIDELGQERIVRYVSGKGGLTTNEVAYKPNSLLPTSQTQPQLMQQNFGTLPQQIHVFKPTSYLQTRSITPVYPVPASVNPSEVENKSPLPPTRTASETKSQIYRLPTPLNSRDRGVSLYDVPAVVQRNHARETFTRLEEPTIPVFQLTAPSRRVSEVNSSPANENKALISQAQRTPRYSAHSSKMSRESNMGVDTSQQTHKVQPRIKMSTKPSLGVQIQRIQKNEVPATEQPQTTKIEYDYYDNSSPFIDIKRLTYNIGTDKLTPV